MNNYEDIQNRIKELYFNKSLFFSDDDWYNEIERVSEDLKTLKNKLLLGDKKITTDNEIDIIYIPIEGNDLYEEYKIYIHNTNNYVGSIYYKVIDGKISYYIEKYNNINYIFNALILIKERLGSRIIISREDNNTFLINLIEKMNGKLIDTKKNIFVYKIR